MVVFLSSIGRQYMFENFTNLSNVFFSPWVYFCLIWEFYRFFNRFPFSYLFAPARHSRSIVTKARNSPPPRMKREPWFCKKSFIQHVLWLDLIRVTVIIRPAYQWQWLWRWTQRPHWRLHCTHHREARTPVYRNFSVLIFFHKFIRNQKIVHGDLEGPASTS